MLQGSTGILWQSKIYFGFQVLLVVDTSFFKFELYLFALAPFSALCCGPSSQVDLLVNVDVKLMTGSGVKIFVLFFCYIWYIIEFEIWDFIIKSSENNSQGCINIMHKQYINQYIEM